MREGLLSAPLDDLSAVTLMGSRCSRCHETSLGVGSLCQNCGSDALTAVSLGKNGTLWTFTVVRHKPPGDYRGAEPFVPFGLGLVELPEGIRVLAPLGTAIDGLHIGQDLVFQPVVFADGQGGELVAFEFLPVDQQQDTVRDV